MTQTAQEINHAEQNAKSWAETIEELVARLSSAISDEEREELETEINEAPLSLEVRGGWHTPGDDNAEPFEYRILLTTGGPALRIVGELNEHNEPESAELQYQDWGTPWTAYRQINEGVLMEFAQQFYYGE